MEAAAVILFPLAPHALLALFRRGTEVVPPFKLDHAETAEINREIIANATRWALERSSRKITVGLTVPPLPADAVVTEGPFPATREVNICLTLAHAHVCPQYGRPPE